MPPFERCKEMSLERDKGVDVHAHIAAQSDPSLKPQQWRWVHRKHSDSKRCQCWAGKRIR